ncbi:MAG: hypothetical protein QW453_04885 [Thermoprotei archaeon]
MTTFPRIHIYFVCTPKAETRIQGSKHLKDGETYNVVLCLRR